MTSSPESQRVPTGSKDSPAATDLAQKPIDRLVEIMRLLRGESGCPWDREQTLETLKQYLQEESCEVLDAIDSGDRKLLEEELGDLLLQVVFQAQICAEEGSFTFDDVATHISDKLVRRHPHIFGDVQAEDAETVKRNWDAIKRDEKAGEVRSAVDGVPRHFPALHKADKIQRKAAKVGFDWDDVHDVVAKLDEELAEIKEALAQGHADRIREEIGDLLFATVNLSRFLGHHAEEVLDETVAKFVRRFKAIEERVHAGGGKMTDCSLAELDAIWEEVKRGENR